MNDRLMIAAMHAAGRAANSDLLTSNEQVEASKSLRFADALIAAAGEGGDPALHENCVGVAIHNVIVDRIQGERDNAICRLTDRDAQVATLQAKVASLTADLEDLNSETVSRIFHNNLMGDLHKELDRKQERIDHYERTRSCHSPYSKRPILYTDTVNGEQCCVDNLWAVSTQELNESVEKIAELHAKVARLERQLEPLTEDECVHLGGSYFTPADMVRVDSAIMAVKAGRGE